MVQQHVFVVLEHHNAEHDWPAHTYLSEFGASREALRCEMAQLEVQPPRTRYEMTGVK